jgi:peptidyl-prolyl cis-trans isomerase SurA
VTQRIGWALGAVLLLAATAAGQGVVVDKVVAVVNDDVITLSELQKEGRPLIQRIRDDLRGDARATQMQITQRQILDALILRRLQLQEARKERVVVEESEVTATIGQVKRQSGFTSDAELTAALAEENLTLEEFKTKVWEQLVVDRLLTRKVRTSVVISEEEITEYYRRHGGDARQHPSVRIRHILVSLPEEPTPAVVAQARERAQEALAQLKAGVDFALVAARYSDGAAARDGGNLGMIQKGELTPALEAVAFSLPRGGVSDVIQTGAGLNILKVEERTEGDVPIAEVRDQARQRLFAEKLTQRMNAYLAELKQKAYIDVRLSP